MKQSEKNFKFLSIKCQLDPKEERKWRPESKKISKKECPSCRGYGEIMKRDFALDSDGSEDIGGTPYVSGCPKCNGEGEIEYDPNVKPKRLTEEEKLKLIKRLKSEGKI